MKTPRTLSLLLALFSTLTLSAQKAKIKAGYDYNYLDPRGIEKHKEFLLLAGNEHSMFYNRQTQYLDSLVCTDEGYSWYVRTGIVMMGQVMGKPSDEAEAILESSSIGRPTSLYVVRDKEKFKIWDEVYDEYRKYSENIEERNWEIEADSVKTILGYDCIMASTTYHGRQWKAWFTPDIPINAGPWKLLGLPGLIMEAIDSTFHHHFTINGIVSTSIPFPKIGEPYSYEKTTRKEFLKLCRFRYDNYQGMRDLHFGTDAPKVSQEKIDRESGKPGFDFLETDYR